MHKTEIINLVEDAINKSLQGVEIENPKFDFKSNWYDFGKDESIMEFLKDTSAMANTVGLDGFIVIGFNDKDGEFTNQSFAKNSKLIDSSYLINKIIKHIDRSFTINLYEEIINGNTIGILHIPPSLDKPHIIRCYKTYKDGKINKEYKNEIFIRKGSQTEIANKWDLELMYYDRKNVIPEFEFHCSITKRSIAINNAGPQGIIMDLNLIIENSGRRPVTITNINLELFLFHDPTKPDEIYKFIEQSNLTNVPIVLSANSIVTKNIKFSSIAYYSNYKFNDIKEEIEKYIHQFKIKNIELTTNLDMKFKRELIIVK